MEQTQVGQSGIKFTLITLWTTLYYSVLPLWQNTAPSSLLKKWEHRVWFELYVLNSANVGKMPTEFAIPSTTWGSVIAKQDYLLR